MLTNRINEVKNEVKSAANAARDYPEVSKIKEDLSNLGSDVGNLASRVKADGSALASRVGEEIEHQASEKYSFLKRESRRQMDRMEERVHAKPMQSIAFAFGAGIALALLARR